MRTFRIRRPSPALVISLLALTVALGGTAYAGFSIPKNSVGTKQLKNGAVTTSKIKNGTVTKSKINTSGLTVPNAANAGHASTADFATNATNATNAANVNGSSPATFLDVGRTGIGSCTGDSASSSHCAIVTVPFAAPGRALVIADTDWFNFGSITTAPNSSCKILVDGTALPGAESDPGVSTSDVHPDSSHPAHTSISGVTNVLAAGNHTFELNCLDTTLDLDFLHSMVTAVRISAG